MKSVCADSLQVSSGSGPVQAAIAAMLVVLSGTAFGQVAAPVFNPGSSQAAVSFNVQVTCSTPGATVRYTVNGAVPTINDPLVPNGNLVLIPRSVTLKAMAWLGQTTSPVTMANYAVVGEIAAGGTHVLAVRANQSAYAWGQRQDGRLANGAGEWGRVTLPAAAKRSASLNYTDIQNVAAGLNHSVVLNANGAVQSFGLNTSGQLGINSVVTPWEFYPRTVLANVAGDYLANCIQVTAGSNFSAALNQWGYVFTWGDNSSGRLGRYVSSTENRYSGIVMTGGADPAPLGSISQVAAGGGHMLARTAHSSESSGGTGSVWVWGLNASGQLGLNNTTNMIRATQATLLNNISDISAGLNHSAVVKWNAANPGRVLCFGQQEFGRLGNEAVGAVAVTTPVAVKIWDGTNLEQIVAVAAGPRHTLALDIAGGVWAWGSNQDGELGDNSLDSRGRARRVSNPAGTGYLINIVNIAAGGVEGDGFSLATAADGTIYGWGANSNAQLGLGNWDTPKKLPVEVSPLKLTNQGSPSVQLSAVWPKTYESTSITLNATASDVDGLGDIPKVEFKNGTTLLVTDTTAPYSFNWTSVAAGSYSLTATATDIAGTVGTSSASLNVRAYVSVEPVSGHGTITEEGLTQGIFRISRETSNSSPLTVTYTLSGTALSGLDYVPIPGYAVIPANQTSVDVIVLGKADYLTEGDETIVLAVLDDASHFPNAGTGPATVTLLDVAPVYDPNAANVDTDGDGLTNDEELALGTNLADIDTDGDGVPDFSDGTPTGVNVVNFAASTLMVTTPRR